jgi:hypothetical protein
MSIENGDTTDGSIEVVDDEGSVDQKIKNRIIKARNRVDEVEQEIFIGVATDPEVTLRFGEKVQAWGMIVRQFIRTIRPLLTDDGIPGAHHYWTQVPLLDDTIAPPDGEYPWSRFGDEETDDMLIAQSIGLPPEFATDDNPPEPKEIDIRGLRSVLERERVSLSWSFKKKPQAIPPESGPVHLSEDYPLPKSVYEAAVEHADAFLQEAGIGLELGKGGLESDSIAPDY